VPRAVLLYLFIKKAFKLTAVIIEEYNITSNIQNFIQHSFLEINSIHR
jgi:hypothetical protein